MSDIGFWDVIIWTFWLMILATWLAMAFFIVREVLSRRGHEWRRQGSVDHVCDLGSVAGRADLHLHPRAHDEPTACAEGSRRRAGPSFVNLERAVTPGAGYARATR